MIWPFKKKPKTIKTVRPDRNVRTVGPVSNGIEPVNRPYLRSVTDTKGNTTTYNNTAVVADYGYWGGVSDSSSYSSSSCDSGSSSSSDGGSCGGGSSD